MLVQQGRDAVGVGEHAGDVGGGAEAADEQRAVRVVGEPLLQLVEVDVAVRVLVDHDDVGDRLPPGELVGVVFVGSEEHHRPLGGRGSLGRARSGCQPAGRRSSRMATSLFTAAVAPEPQKITRSSAVPPTASRIIGRASSQQPGVCSPVPELSVWVLA